MRPLEHYVSDRRLVAILCRKRLAMARKSRRQLFVSKFSGVQAVATHDVLLQVLPPRRHWPRLLRRERAGADDLPRANAACFAEYVLDALVSRKQYQWTTRLRLFLDQLRDRVLNWKDSDSFKPHRHIPIPKARPGRGQKYRVLAPYALQDALVDSVFASYLRDRIDAALDPDCYAFRLPRDGRPVTHHDAVAGLRRFARMGTSRSLWVAECDIQGFFDSVSHHVTRRELFRMLGDEPSPVDPRLLAFCESFLRGYDYRDARSAALAKLARQGIANAKIYDVTATLSQNRLPVSRTGLGIPQGSSFSSVLANVVLTAADRAVRYSTKGHRQTFYARYVDDIVVASTNRRVAASALSSYRRALRALALPDHQPLMVSSTTRRSRKAYWDAKSKAPYAWANVGSAGVRWVGFLGYQIRRDGLLRARLSSIRKESAKQRRAVDDILSKIDKARIAALKRGRTQGITRLRRICYSAMLHLISFGVGYPSRPRVWPATNGVSWASGFRLLREGPSDLSALRALDRSRGVALRALHARLVSLIRLPGAKERQVAGTSPVWAIRRDGRPLSYHAQFTAGQRA